VGPNELLNKILNEIRELNESLDRVSTKTVLRNLMVVLEVYFEQQEKEYNELAKNLQESAEALRGSNDY